MRSSDGSTLSARGQTLGGNRHQGSGPDALRAGPTLAERLRHAVNAPITRSSTRQPSDNTCMEATNDQRESIDPCNIRRKVLSGVFGRIGDIARAIKARPSPTIQRLLTPRRFGLCHARNHELQRSQAWDRAALTGGFCEPHRLRRTSPLCRRITPILLQSPFLAYSLV